MMLTESPAQCPSDQINGAYLPPVWSDTSTTQCGFIYPSDTPMEEYQGTLTPNRLLIDLHS